MWLVSLLLWTTLSRLGVRSADFRFARRRRACLGPVAALSNVVQCARLQPTGHATASPL